MKLRAARNEIKTIFREDGCSISDQEEIKDYFCSSFKDQRPIGEQRIIPSDPLLAELPSLSANHIEWISLPFTKEDIKIAAFSSKSLKSPGPYGIPPSFIQQNWEIVEESINKSVLGFLFSGHLLNEQNKTFITLIPKVERPQRVKEYKPISLCNTSYEIISKLLVNRLKPILKDLVGDFQNAFVPSRQMTDNCLIAHEVFNWIKKRKKRDSLRRHFESDLSKAHDRIRWDFVEAVLRRMKFPKIWINWIIQCISTVSYSILVNGEPSKFFKPSAGLRQGDPLSPYLFILCMETLSTKFCAAQISKDIQGIKIARAAPSLSHLFFVDDALFFFKAIPKNCWFLKNLLKGFCDKSGELINYEKSQVTFSPNTPRRFMKLMRKPLGVPNSNSFGSYLGCPMEVDGRNSSPLNAITLKIHQKITSWEFLHTSPAGKLILINTILASLAAHIISIYLLPVKVEKKITSSLVRY